MKIQINAKNRTYSFESNEKELLLYSGLRNGINLPYECGTGTCGTCKAKLIDGKIHEPWPDAPGLKYVKRGDGEFLMCQCIARTDLTVELASFVYSSDPGAILPQSFYGIVHSAKLLTRDVLSLTIEPDKPVDFEAGQFIGVAIPGIPGYRAYSMVNFERKAKVLEFVIKKKPDGRCSDWLFNPDNKIEGVTVDLIGPLGHAIFQPNAAKNILCIAGGSGIAGMMSIMSRGVQERYFEQYKGNVFFGVRTLRDSFFMDELAGFKKAFPKNVNVVVAFSDEEVPDSARADYPDIEFEHGLVHEVAARRMEGKYKDIRAYLAGPPPLVDAAIRTLIVGAKLSTDNIVYDKFS